jgi:hypothetical protein
VQAEVLKEVLKKVRTAPERVWKGVRIMIRKRRKRAEKIPVSNRQFVEVWQRSESIAEVARKLKSTRNACRVRAYRYRKMGVPLKDLPYAEWLSPGKLAELARSLLPNRP